MRFNEAPSECAEPLAQDGSWHALQVERRIEGSENTTFQITQRVAVRIRVDGHAQVRLHPQAQLAFGVGRQFAGRDKAETQGLDEAGAQGATERRASNRAAQMVARAGAAAASSIQSGRMATSSRRSVQRRCGLPECLVERHGEIRCATLIDPPRIQPGLVRVVETRGPFTGRHDHGRTV